MTDFSADKLAAFLWDASRYFANRPIHGEDADHWSNVYNAENCQKASAAILAMAEREKRMREALERIASQHPRPEQDEGEPGQRCRHCWYRRKLSAPMEHSEICAYAIARRALGEEKA